MHITIIEDEKVLSSNIAKKLNKNWYNTDIISSYNDYLLSDNNNTDLYVIDISLRDWSWFDIIKDLRSEKKLLTPIIITSWYSETEKKIYWLDLWADDYLPKPYSVDELIARIRALLRRSFNTSLDSEVIYNDISYSSSDKLIKRNWKIIELTWREMQFVEYMLFNIWKIITKTELINSVWWKFDELEVSDNTINVTISKVRKKIWKNFKLKTIVNRWYLLEE